MARVIGTLIRDRSGKPIREGEKFNFKYLEELDKAVKLIGSFSWNDIELRYEIDIEENNDRYICLSYVVSGVMFDFELI